MKVNINNYELLGPVEVGILLQSEETRKDSCRYLAIDKKGDFIILMEYSTGWEVSLVMHFIQRRM